jgi:hypothetical protein
MTESPGAGALRASDAERDAAAEKLADAVASGRLTMTEHNSRLDAVFAAGTSDQLAAVVADLPSRPAAKSGLYQAIDPHKCVVIGGRITRAGRFRIGRFCKAVAIFGQIDLDLRSVVLSHDMHQVTVVVRSFFGTVRIIAPAGWRLEEQVFVLGSKRAIDRPDNGSTVPPILRVNGYLIGGSFELADA